MKNAMLVIITVLSIMLLGSTHSGGIGTYQMEVLDSKTIVIMDTRTSVIKIVKANSDEKGFSERERAIDDWYQQGTSD